MGAHEGGDAPHLHQLPGIEPGDECGAAEAGLDQPLSLQPAQGFPDRLDGDGQGGGQATLGNLAVRGEGAIDDRFPQPLISLVGMGAHIAEHQRGQASVHPRNAIAV